MSITNYWFQLIWILTAGIILTRFLPKKQEIVMGRIEERWQMAPGGAAGDSVHNSSSITI